MTSGSPLLDLVRSLAFPRFPGTAGEKRAADSVTQAFADAGLEVRREPFVASSRALFLIRAMFHGIAGGLALTMGLAAPQAPALVALAAVILLLLLARAGIWPRPLESWFDAPPLLSSENVVGRSRARIEDSDGASPIQVVILAHLDSKSSRFPTFVTVAALLTAAGLVLFAGVHAGLAAVGAVSPLPFGVSLAISCAAIVALGFSLSNPSGNESPGAMDNASGLAILIDAARTLPEQLRGSGISAELIFLATGAEEIGLAGAMRWIQAHEPELDRARTIFVNVDSVGVGRGLFALDVHGAAPSGRSMRDVVGRAARAANVRIGVLVGLPGVGVDTMPIAARGYATVTILGRVMGEASRRIHSQRDTVDALTEEGLQDAARTVREIVREAQIVQDHLAVQVSASPSSALD